MAENKPTSHDYARELQKVAEFLLSREAFNWPHSPNVYTPLPTYTKEDFIAIVKGLGSGKKGRGYLGDEITFTKTVSISDITVSIARDKMCRLIRPAEYDCEPFLSPEEEESLGGAA